MSSQKRGRPELYTEAVCKTLLANAKEEGLSIKEYCRQSPHNHVYITVIVALKRYGLSPRASKVGVPTVASMPASGAVVLMDEEDATELAIAEAEAV